MVETSRKKKSKMKKKFFSMKFIKIKLKIIKEINLMILIIKKNFV